MIDNNIFKIMIVAIICSFIFACEPNYFELEKGVYIKDSKLYMVGGINHQLITATINLYDKALKEGKKPILQVESIGGDFMAALRLTKYIRDKEIEIRTDKMCASACANFILPSAKRAYIGKYAIVALHGGAQNVRFPSNDEESNIVDGADLATIIEGKRKIPADHKFISKSLPINFLLQKGNQYKRFSFTECAPQPNYTLELRVKNFESCKSRMIMEEQKFYSELNIDPKLPYIGVSAMKRNSAETGKVTIGFVLSKAMWKQMGVHHIEFDDEWDIDMFQTSRIVTVKNVSGASSLTE